MLLNVLVGALVKLSRYVKFDTSCGIVPASTAHSSAKLEKDIQMTVNELKNTSKVFQHTANQSHSSLTVKGSLYATVKKPKLISWMKDRLAIIKT